MTKTADFKAVGVHTVDGSSESPGVASRPALPEADCAENGDTQMIILPSEFKEHYIGSHI